MKPLDRLNSPKHAVLQVKGQRAGLGLAAVYLKGEKKIAKKAPFGGRTTFKKSEDLGMYRTYLVVIQILILFDLFHKKQVLNSEDSSFDAI